MGQKSLFLIIPLILSIGLVSSIPFSNAVESNQICIDKVWLENSKGKIACVTPTTADKLVERGWALDESETEPEPKRATEDDCWDSQGQGAEGVLLQDHEEACQ